MVYIVERSLEKSTRWETDEPQIFSPVTGSEGRSGDGGGRGGGGEWREGGGTLSVE